MSDVKDSTNGVVRMENASYDLGVIRWLEKFVRLVLTRPLILTSTFIIVVIISLSILADLISPYDPLVQDISNRLESPGKTFFLGTDHFGRDVFSRIIHGSQSSLYIAISAVTIGTLLGTAIGIISSYRGGLVDLISQRMIDTLLGFPSLVLAIILIVTLGRTSNVITIAIAVALIPQFVRLARSRTLSIREESFVLAAQANGASPLRIIFKHILPHSIGPIISYAMGYVSVALVAESALSYLGFGVPPPSPSWGGMLHEGLAYLEIAPWITIFPGFILSLTALSFSLLGDALRDMLDPRGSLSPALQETLASEL